MKLLPSLFSCVYSRVKLFVFAINSRRRYSIFVCFVYELEEKNSKSEVIFAVCHLPSAVNVMLNLSNVNVIEIRCFRISHNICLHSAFSPTNTWSGDTYAMGFFFPFLSDLSTPRWTCGSSICTGAAGTQRDRTTPGAVVLQQEQSLKFCTTSPSSL